MRTLLAVAIAVIALGCSGGSKKPGICKSDKDCKTGVCTGNQCVECKDDKQCPGGKKCHANACVAKSQCERDDQCPTGQTCRAGACKPCLADGDCPSGTCESGACKPASKCSKDEDCKEDEDCVNGFCKKAGGTRQPPDVTCTLSTVYFGFDDASVGQAERDHLDANAQCIEKAKGKAVYIFGHTDAQGTEEYNIALSERRAQSVADYLARLGVDPVRLQVVPKGKTQPTGLGDDKDRRCEFQWK
jgi:peptidoglycan-associated lipoprotein